ncbi:MAG: class I SAM-dependent RNA methyltransferase [Sediminimonas qiaohouensis]|uniref:Class I SAM-dependent RNA methyltransferase n=1 Tax=Sediminimonas qiaohouensis TaxID=552061 RepID=A0A7C9L7X9_9RHOB|nr:class I SAM-dependent RNA methyltransferase [Sediminimonas qiaohouensis]MTJ04695.1 class I SAM-dependent RNA methyltransferase [Sediminimonas qiaohouensis]
MEQHRINRLGLHGDGIGDGPIYAQGALPGEIVSGVRTDSLLEQIRIVEPSPDRVKAPCRHAKSCGGCQLQHASETFVANWKLDVVKQALTAQGLEAPFRPIVTSPPKSRRRATLSARRTKSGAIAGFHARGSDTVVQIPDCQLLHPDLMAALPVAEQLARIGTSRKGELSVQATLSLNGLDIAVQGGKPLDAALRAALAAEAERHKLARLSWQDECVAMRARPEQAFGKSRVTPPPGAFLQATPEGEQALLCAVREIMSGTNRIADLFAGCGTFALPLAETAEVLAVEGDAAMIAALDEGWRHATGLKQVTSTARDLFRRPLRSDELRGVAGVVIDPPRAGAEAQVEELAQAQVGRIAFVSCNPVTFARDAKRLVDAGYRIQFIQVVDQFRWSSHVELVAGFHLPGPQ